MKQFLSILLIISLNLFCSIKESSTQKNLFYLYLLSIQNIPNENRVSLIEAEEKIYNNAINLISPLGEFHWRGLCHPDKNAIGSCGNFHSNEQGDATMHSGILLMSLAWKWKNLNDPSILPVIDKLLSFYELQQSLNNKGLGRNIIEDRFYQKFPDSEKNGTDIFQIPEVAGNHMRHRNFQKDGITYWHRYDVSVDAIAHSMIGCYWVFRLVPVYSERAKSIMKNQYDFYTLNNWTIKDDSGNTLRYGLHSPGLNPFSSALEIIFEKVLNDKNVMSLLDHIVLNTPSYNRDLRTNYFNSYIAFSLYLVLNDLGFDIKTGVTNIYKEIDRDSNYFGNQVYNLVIGVNEKSRIDSLTHWTINKGHHFGTIELTYELPLELRKGYNKWESSPYESGVTKVNENDFTGNEDFLQVYWLK